MRIVTELIGTAIATADYRQRGATGYAASTTVPSSTDVPLPSDGADAYETLVGAPEAASPLLEPPAPPGTAFAAAVMAGALPPTPVTPQEILLRLGSAWVPPESDFQLADILA